MDSAKLVVWRREPSVAVLLMEGETRWRERGGAQGVGLGVPPCLFSFRAGKPVEAVAHDMQRGLERRHVQIRMCRQKVLLGIGPGHPTMLWVRWACIPDGE